MRATHDCRTARQGLHLFLGGDLEAPLAEGLERHLAACDPCCAELEGARRARAVYLSAASDAEADAVSLWPGVRARLVEEGILAPVAETEPARPARPAHTAPGGRPFPLRRVAGFAAAAAAVLLALPLLAPEPAAPDRAGGAGEGDVAPALVERALPVVAPALADGAVRLRPVLGGEETLIERAARQTLGAEPSGDLEQAPAYQVVNESRDVLRLR